MSLIEYLVGDLDLSGNYFGLVLSFDSSFEGLRVYSGILSKLVDCIQVGPTSFVRALFSDVPSSVGGRHYFYGMIGP